MAQDPLHLTRLDSRRYRGQNHRGAEVIIGNGPGEFMPGELLQIALAACNTLSADATLEHRLGPDFAADARVWPEKNETENRYDALHVEFQVDPGELDPEEWDALLRLARRSIDKHCTVGRTLDHAVNHDVDITPKEG